MSGCIRGRSNFCAIQKYCYPRHRFIVFIHDFSLNDERLFFIVFHLFPEKNNCFVQYPERESRVFQTSRQHFFNRGSLQIQRNIRDLFHGYIIEKKAVLRLCADVVHHTFEGSILNL